MICRSFITAWKWGEEQAENYLEFLNEIAQELADQPGNASLVRGRKNILVFIAHWPNAHYGHRIFFRETENGIVVLRILHTAMKWQKHLKRGE